MIISLCSSGSSNFGKTVVEILINVPTTLTPTLAVSGGIVISICSALFHAADSSAALLCTSGQATMSELYAYASAAQPRRSARVNSR